jgi:hypothetical protein
VKTNDHRNAWRCLNCGALDTVKTDRCVHCGIGHLTNRCIRGCQWVPISEDGFCDRCLTWWAEGRINIKRRRWWGSRTTAEVKS